jgi:hypothetical protein
MPKKIESKGDAILLMAKATGELKEELAKNVPPTIITPRGKRNRCQSN